MFRCPAPRLRELDVDGYESTPLGQITVAPDSGIRAQRLNVVDERAFVSRMLGSLESTLTRL